MKTALGFEYEEIKTIIEEDRNGKKRTRIEKTKKYMPPSPTAQAFWLKNRKKDEWGDRKEIVFDTKGQEEERKLQFLKIINEEVIDAYSIVGEAATLPDPEVIEEMSSVIWEINALYKPKTTRNKPVINLVSIHNYSYVLSCYQGKTEVTWTHLVRKGVFICLI